ncbi:MAG: hypothetical protein KAJ18_05370 [Candidatus Omnitrophica bacterium]|nr:hypothetical protein [Candidatus Omnitrophota bacterium]
MNRNFDDILEEICEKDTRYTEDAYEFVLDALSFAQKKYKRTKHVTGKELLEGTKVLLMDRFGPMTLTVLKHWGINSTEDFGNIVFNLVEQKVLSKTEDDSIESFRNAYDFDIVFDKVYRRRMDQKISRMR